VGTGRHASAAARATPPAYGIVNELP
jgi:hypothetical protein